jgi:hypothetical protein
MTRAPRSLSLGSGTYRSVTYHSRDILSKGRIRLAKQCLTMS